VTKPLPIDVSASGAVLLGQDIVCDGFHFDAKARIQTHIHEDHMDEFAASKGFQDVLMSRATRSLLIAERNADLPYRDNIRALEPGTVQEYGQTRVSLLPNGHMLGSVQVLVESPSGQRYGYSGDFSWPLEQVIQVDALVLDSTYGNPQSQREYSQADVEQRLLELVLQQLKTGPVNIVANRGTLHRALQVLAGQLDCPMIGSPRLCREVEVYREFGCCIDEVVLVQSAKGKEALAEQRHVRLFGTGDKRPTDEVVGSRIVLSAFMSRPDDPVLAYGATSFRIALSDHADFEGTMQYVQASGAQYVVTDNTRGGNAVLLANAVRERLGIYAVPSTNQSTNQWGE
jgi:putative mRNA 3-end processing factor